MHLHGRGLSDEAASGDLSRGGMGSRRVFVSERTAETRIEERALSRPGDGLPRGRGSEILGRERFKRRVSVSASVSISGRRLQLIRSLERVRVFLGIRMIHYLSFSWKAEVR